MEQTVDLANFVFAELSQPKLDFSDYDTTIAGRSGSGKTTLALEMFKGKCCLVDVENGGKAFKGIYRIVPTSWKELLKVQKDWKKAIKAGHKPPFSVLIFDTQTKLSAMCDDYVLNANGWEDFTQGKDGVNRWNVRKKEYETLMNSFKELGFKVVYICHGKDKNIKLRGQEEYKQFVPDVSTSFEYPVLGEVDFVFYLEKTRIKGADDKPREVRRLILQNDLDYNVKCRFPELPDEIIYENVTEGVQAFFKAWDNAVNGDDNEEVETNFAFASATETVSEPKVEVASVIDEDDEDDDLQVDPLPESFSLEQLQSQAIEIRDMLLEEKPQDEVKAILKEKLGKVKIANIDDVNALKAFINEYK